MIRKCLIIVLVASCFLGIMARAKATAADYNLPGIKVTVPDSEDKGRFSTAIEIVILLTVLSLAPAILVMMTSFTRLAVVLSFLRHAIGTQQSPPNQIIVGLALFLTFFIMTPVWKQIQTQAINPYLADQITQKEALTRAIKPIKAFMIHQTRKKDLMLFLKIKDKRKPENLESVSLSAVIPAFVISELKTAFQIGFLIYLPFLVIDMVVASVLLSMGMMMLPPVLISLPFKLMLFVLADGWYLVIDSLVKSFY
ncbi:MAG: flagellar biosynthetic protein FliP [Deltaproteobacteria bacterium]|nr:MAG: flagellar biosynthetic protein FliP [Deltaproteobacteria bacterium]